jgi:hypothetical protein
VEEADCASRRADGAESAGLAVLRLEEEEIIVAVRKHTLLSLEDDCLYVFQATIPHLTRSPLHRCLQRHGISRLLDMEGDKPDRKNSRLITRSASSTSRSTR